jgi:hypothetical protein
VRICVELDLEKGLLKAIQLTLNDCSYIQQVDYEKLPFKCKAYHEYGHFMKCFPEIQSTHPQSGEKDQSKTQNNKCGSRNYRTQQPPEVHHAEADPGPLFSTPFVSGGGGGDHESSKLKKY